MPPMGKQSGHKSGGAGKYKPHRVTRIPGALAELMQECADEDGEKFTWEVRQAIREYLRSRGKLPPKPKPAD